MEAMNDGSDDDDDDNGQSTVFDWQKEKERVSYLNERKIVKLRRIVRICHLFRLLLLLFSCVSSFEHGTPESSRTVCC